MKREKEERDDSTEEENDDYEDDNQKFEGILEENSFDEVMRTISQRGSIKAIRKW